MFAIECLCNLVRQWISSTRRQFLARFDKTLKGDVVMVQFLISSYYASLLSSKINRIYHKIYGNYCYLPSLTSLPFLLLSLDCVFLCRFLSFAICFVHIWVVFYSSWSHLLNTLLSLQFVLASFNCFSIS